MSRPQHLFLPINAGSLGHASASCVSRDLQPSTLPGYIVQGQIPIPLEIIIKSIESFALQLQTQLKMCLFSKVEEEIKFGLVGDIKCIRDVLLVVLYEYQELAQSFRQLMSVPTQPNATERAQTLLQKAWSSIKEAIGELTSLAQSLVDKGELLETEVLKEAKHPWLHTLVDRKIPEGSVVSGLIWTLGGAIYNAAAADNIEKHVKGAAAVQTFWALSGAIFGTTFGAIIAYYGCEANIYRPEAREATKSAIENILILLQQFSKDIGHLKSYWRNTHYQELHRHGAWGGPLQLDQIVAMFEKQIENYSDMTTSFDKHIPMQATAPLLSPTELYEQRRRMLLLTV